MLFFSFQWNWPVWVFPIYRVVVAIYIVAWSAVGFIDSSSHVIDHGHPAICYVTIWSFLLLASYLTLAALISVIHAFLGHSSMSVTTSQNMSDVEIKYPSSISTTPEDASLQSDPTNMAATEVASDPTLSSITSVTTTQSIQPTNGRQRLACHHQLLWVLFNMAAGVAPVVTGIYFSVLYPMILNAYPDYSASVFDIHVHGVNFLVILVELAISSIPIRLFHAIYPLIYGFIYIVFSLIYWSLDKEENVLYPYVLDWNHPGITVGVICALFIVIPLIQLGWFGLYNLRLHVFKKIYGYEYMVL